MKLILLKCKHDKRERCHIQILPLQEKGSMSISIEYLIAQNSLYVLVLNFVHCSVDPI